MSSGGSEEHADSDAELERLRAQLAEAQGIARWLYDRLPVPVRHFLGDVSEWPFLLHSHEPAHDVPAPFCTVDRDRDVLRAFARIQAAGGDPYDATHVAARLDLTDDEFADSIRRLIGAGLVTGGQLPSRAFVETVTSEGMRVAGVVDAGGTQLPVFRTDLAGYSRSGYGHLRVPAGVDLAPEQTILVTDEEADVLEARVLKVNGDTAHVQVNWGRGHHTT